MKNITNNRQVLPAISLHTADTDTENSEKKIHINPIKYVQSMFMTSNPFTAD